MLNFLNKKLIASWEFSLKEERLLYLPLFLVVNLSTRKKPLVRLFTVLAAGEGGGEQSLSQHNPIGFRKSTPTPTPTPTAHLAAISIY